MSGGVSGRDAISKHSLMRCLSTLASFTSCQPALRNSSFTSTCHLRVTRVHLAMPPTLVGLYHSSAESCASCKTPIVVHQQETTDQLRHTSYVSLTKACITPHEENRLRKPYLGLHINTGRKTGYVSLSKASTAGQ